MCTLHESTHTRSSPHNTKNTKYTRTLHTHYTHYTPHLLPLHHPATSPFAPPLSSSLPSSTSSFPSFPSSCHHPTHPTHPLAPFASSHPQRNLIHWHPPLLPRAPHLPARHLTGISNSRPGSPTIAGCCCPAVCAAFWGSWSSRSARRMGFPARQQGQLCTLSPGNCVSFCDREDSPPPLPHPLHPRPTTRAPSSCPSSSSSTRAPARASTRRRPRTSLWILWAWPSCPSSAHPHSPPLRGWAFSYPVPLSCFSCVFLRSSRRARQKRCRKDAKKVERLFWMIWLHRCFNFT